MRLTMEVPVSDLVDQLTETGYQNAVMDLIKGLDRAMADYEFTLALAKYLVKELQTECALSEEPFKLEELL